MNKQSGFTLIELVVTITLLGIVAVIGAQVLRIPFDLYLNERASLNIANELSTTAQQYNENLKLALPNSIRVSPDGSAIEFVKVIGGGKYLANQNSDGTGIPLDFSQAINTFDVVFADVSDNLQSSLLVIYNLGISGDDIYSGDNSAVISSINNNTVLLSTAKQFPYQSPAQRFFITKNKSTVYACIGTGTKNGEGTGKLISFDQPMVPGNIASAIIPQSYSLLADGISACSFGYIQGVDSHSGIVNINIQVTRNNSTVRLYRETAIINEA